MWRSLSGNFYRRLLCSPRSVELAKRSLPIFPPPSLQPAYSARSRLFFSCETAPRLPKLAIKSDDVGSEDLKKLMERFVERDVCVIYQIFRELLLRVKMKSLSTRKHDDKIMTDAECLRELLNKGSDDFSESDLENTDDISESDIENTARTYRRSERSDGYNQDWFHELNELKNKLIEGEKDDALFAIRKKILRMRLSGEAGDTLDLYSRDHKEEIEEFRVPPESSSRLYASYQCKRGVFFRHYSNFFEHNFFPTMDKKVREEVDFRWKEGSSIFEEVGQLQEDVECRYLMEYLKSLELRGSADLTYSGEPENKEKYMQDERSHVRLS
ncbi:unnamed protein product [Linum trigynum]|uniref:Uncharacterized protein n=1 Tax=Linum trigynum TaxID=586398 RepID=A0AAV2FKY2_9ROSI